MFKKLDFILEKYEELSMTVSDPEVIANQSLWQQKIKELGEMEPVVNKYKEYKKVQDDLAATEEMLNELGSDDEMREMAKEEATALEEALPKMEEEIRILLIPENIERSRPAERSVFGSDCPERLLVSVLQHQKNSFVRHGIHRLA